MPTTSLVPTSTTDADSNINTGDHTDIDETIASADGAVVDSVTNQWTNQVDNTTGGFFEFGITDAPGDFVSFNSIKLEVRAEFTASNGSDTGTYRFDISGTNAPTDVLEWDETDDDAGMLNRSFTSSAVSPSAADIDGWTVRVYQWLFSQFMAPDAMQINIDAIELTLDYSNTAGGGDTKTLTILGVG